jgi:hypothetical protein
MPAQTPSLFTEPFAMFAAERMRIAEAAVLKLSEEDLQSATLGQALAEIGNFNFQLAVLQPDQKTGTRRTDQRRFSDYGRQVIENVDVLDISIPYSGFPRSFSLAPTNGHDIRERATAHSGAPSRLTVTLDENEELEAKLATFILQVQENLQRLGEDIEALRKRLVIHAQSKAEERINEIKKRDEKNRSYSFPVK